MIQIVKISKQNTEKKETLVYSNARYYKKSYLGSRVQITHNTLPKQLKEIKKQTNEFHILVNGFYSYHINLILESLDYNLDKITNIEINEGILTFASPFGTYKTTEIKKY
jgi:hypothetical protein